MRRALEWIGGNEHKRLAAVSETSSRARASSLISLCLTAAFSPLSLCVLQVLILRELAVHTPTLFYQQIQQFFDNIFMAIRDPKVT